MKVFLVTGAAGFIGSALAKSLIEMGNKVVTIDNLSTGYKENIPAGVDSIIGDCQNEKVIEQLYKYQLDGIFHVAGQSSGEVSFEDPVYDLQTNTQSTLLLLKLAQEKKCPNFVYASTMSVYGDQPELKVSENAPLSPKSFYGVGKLASEQYLRIYQKFGINCTSLRLFNTYGPGQNMRNLKQGMVSIFLAQAINNHKIHVKGDKKRFRDFVFIDDVIQAFHLAMNRREQRYLEVNICSGKKTTIADLISNMKNHLPFDVSAEYEGSTPGDQFGIFGDPSNAIAELEFTARTSLDSGIRKMVDWAMKL